MEIQKFRIRASASGQIMTKARSKNSTLSETAKTYCKNWLKEQIYGKKKMFSNKYTDKGNIMEDNSLDFIADYLNLGVLIKNEKHLDNDFMTGTPDVILRDLVIDVKNSWDCFTFPLFDNELKNKDYYWQAQTYMNLTGKPNFKVIYILSDTPEHLIQREAYWHAKNNGFEELDQDIYDKFEQNMTYREIPKPYKIKIFDIKRDQVAINELMLKVSDCRLYINGLINNL